MELERIPAGRAPQAGPNRPAPRPEATADGADGPVSRRRVRELQQGAGNQAVSAMLAGRPPSSVQRWTNPLVTLKSDDELIKDGLNGDLTAISQISNFAAVKPDDRYRMLDLLIHQAGWVGPRNKKAVVELWAAWGADGLAAAVAARPQLWRDCADQPGWLADVRDLPGVKRLATRVVTDVQAVAVDHLDTNDVAVRAQMARLGIPEPAAAAMPPLTAEQQAEFGRMRTAAHAIAEMQRKQAAAREVHVGWDHGTVNGALIALPVRFSPFRRPPDAYPMGTVGPNPPMVPYDTVKGPYDKVTEAIGQHLVRFPSLYAVSRDGDPAKTEAFASLAGPEQQRLVLSGALRALLRDIAVTKLAISGATIDPLDLSPVVSQVHSGAAWTSTDWTQPLATWTLEDATKQHTMAKALKELGFTQAAVLAGLLAPFTGGGSVLILAGIAAADTLKAVGDWKDYDQLNTASRTAVLPGSSVVGDLAVDDARAQAVASTAAAAMAALSAVLAAVHAVRGGGGPGGPTEPEGPPQLPRLSQSTEANIATLIADSNQEFPLTRVNAERIVTGPPGATAEVAGPGGAGADVVIRARGPNGATVVNREVKCIAGGAQGSFNREVSHAATQIGYSGEIYVQVPEGTDGLRLVLRFRGARQVSELGRYRSVRIVIVEPGGGASFDGSLVP